MGGKRKTTGLSLRVCDKKAMDLLTTTTDFLHSFWTGCIKSQKDSDHICSKAWLKFS